MSAFELTKRSLPGWLSWLKKLCLPKSLRLRARRKSQPISALDDTLKRDLGIMPSEVPDPGGHRAGIYHNISKQGWPFP